MKMRFSLLFCFCIFFTFPTYAEEIAKDTLFDIFIRNLSEVHLTYTQTKKIPELEKFFITEGSIKFVKNMGFVWKQKIPSEIKFVATMERYCTGNSVENLKRLPNFFDIKQLTDAVLNGNYGVLNDVFDVDYVEKGKKWSLVLVPQIKDIADFIRKVVLRGNIEGIDSITAYYSNTTEIQIDFRKIKEKITDEIEC